jgi:hypothetical protein
MDLRYIQKLEPYAGRPDFDDPDDYDHVFDFSACPGRLMGQPFWLGGPRCDLHAVLRKTRSRRLVYDQHYHFDEHALRVIPAADPRARRFFVFLGCSYTMGEGIADSETFANRVVAGSAPANGFNLAMGGFGPNHALLLLRNGHKDLRLSGIHGTDGTAIYTHIDDHSIRLLGSVRYFGRNPFWPNDPDFELSGETLVHAGPFGTARPWTNALYRFLSASELLSFFWVDLPIFGRPQARLFAKVIAETRDILSDQFGVKRFIFSVYPGHRILIDRLRPELEREGVEIFDFSGIELHPLFRGREGFQGNGHPVPEAHRFYAELLLRELARRPAPQRHP